MVQEFSGELLPSCAGTEKVVIEGVAGVLFRPYVDSRILVIVPELPDTEIEDPDEIFHFFLERGLEVFLPKSGETKYVREFSLGDFEIVFMLESNSREDAETLIEENKMEPLDGTTR